MTFTEPSWYSRECNWYQKLTIGINDQSFLHSLQLASSSSCYMQLVSKLIHDCKITNQIFESFVQILLEKNIRSDQVEYCHVP